VLSFGYYLRVIKAMYFEERGRVLKEPSAWLIGSLYFIVFALLVTPFIQNALLALVGLS
jgi:NADH:ubiquinone oxidoreductase subunit 2 (subunit N)